MKITAYIFRRDQSIPTVVHILLRKAASCSIHAVRPVLHALFMQYMGESSWNMLFRRTWLGSSEMYSDRI